MCPSVANEYKLYEPHIGEGAFAKVYRAEIRATGDVVAVKCLKLDFYKDNMDDIRREISIMSQMRHDALVRVYSSFIWQTELWIVMPLLLGSCHAVLKEQHKKGFKDEHLLATILSDTLRGLDYVHKDKLIHRDIKAGNILISFDGSIQLGDFGVAGALNDGGKVKNRRTFTGTPCWMAPEVMEQSSGYDCKADIWSTGITALELAMGSAPYAHFQPMKVLLLTLQEKPPSFATYPDADKQKWSKDFKSFIDMCLQKKPEQRASAKDLLKHPFIKKAKDKAYIKEHLVGPTMTLVAGTQYQEIDIEKKLMDEAKKKAAAEDTGDNIWAFDPDDLLAIAQGTKATLNPTKIPKWAASDGPGEAGTDASAAPVDAAAGETPAATVLAAMDAAEVPAEVPAEPAAPSIDAAPATTPADTATSPLATTPEVRAELAAASIDTAAAAAAAPATPSADTAATTPATTPTEKPAASMDAAATTAPATTPAEAPSIDAAATAAPATTPADSNNAEHFTVDGGSSL